MFDTFESRLTLKGTLVTRSGFRIGSGRSTEPVGTDLPLLKDALERPFIPGSSLKGVLRSQVERVVRAVVPGSKGACIPTGDDSERCIPNQDITLLRQKIRAGVRDELKDDDDKAWFVELLKSVNLRKTGQAGVPTRSAYPAEDELLAEAVTQESCLICQTFGSPWLASHVQVRDLPVVKNGWFGQYQVRDGVAIDRDKGTAGDGKLYNYETVPAGTQFDCQLVLENGEAWQHGLLWVALRPFISGEAALGGFTSRGLGWVQLEDPELRLVSAGSADPAALIDAWLGEGTVVEDDQKKEWIAALKAKLTHQAQPEPGEADDA